MQLDPPRFPDFRTIDALGLRWKIGLIALALTIGFGIGVRLGSGAGSGSGPAAGPEAARRLEGASSATGASTADPIGFEVASDLPDGWTLEAAADPGTQTHDEDLQGKVVARYAAVEIDALPMHDAELEPPDSLTLVTRGRIRRGESLASSLRSRGISPATVHLIATEMSGIFDFRRSRPGDRYRLGQEPDGRVLDFRYSQGPEESFYLAWEGTRYVARKETTELRPQIAKIAGIVDSSFYEAIVALGEQSALAAEFAHLLAWDIDFSRNVQPGDEFQILYERLYRRDDDGRDVYVRPGRILAGRYRGSVGEHTIVYFEDEAGQGSYFRPDGSSVERAFLAAPLEFRRISSRFTRARHHPILNVTRPHPGIDYAAPVGSPVWSVADGVVEYKGRAGASGNLIRVRHVNGYTSHYAHLSRFAKELKVGDRVEQKQVIGYVGSTGLSTGPHVCFRVKKDGRYVDPLKISSPAGTPVEQDRIAEFEGVRDELLADLGAGPISLADEAL